VTVDDRGVTVRDHGEGVPEEDLPYVFDRFFRGANSRSRQGSGLGLAIVRQVTEQHGGHATAANAPGGGAIFTLELPTTPAFDDEPVMPDRPPDADLDVDGVATSEPVPVRSGSDRTGGLF
jgi:signal transduction histidine kinase